MASVARRFVGPHGIAAAELTDEFGALLAEDLAEKLEVLASSLEAFHGDGSNVDCGVELAGRLPNPELLFTLRTLLHGADS